MVGGTIVPIPAITGHVVGPPGEAVRYCVTAVHVENMTEAGKLSKSGKARPECEYYPNYDEAPYVS